MKRETEEDWGVDQKEAPLPGLKKDYSASHKFLGANAGRAGIVARFFAGFSVHFFLLLAGLTGFLFRLLLAGLLLTAVALLLLLVTLI
jgi:hypothetical protein